MEDRKQKSKFFKFISFFIGVFSLKRNSGAKKKRSSLDTTNIKNNNEKNISITTKTCSDPNQSSTTSSNVSEDPVWRKHKEVKEESFKERLKPQDSSRINKNTKDEEFRVKSEKTAITSDIDVHLSRSKEDGGTFFGNKSVKLEPNVDDSEIPNSSYNAHNFWYCIDKEESEVTCETESEDEGTYDNLTERGPVRNERNVEKPAPYSTSKYISIGEEIEVMIAKIKASNILKSGLSVKDAIMKTESFNKEKYKRIRDEIEKKRLGTKNYKIVHLCRNGKTNCKETNLHRTVRKQDLEETCAIIETLKEHHESLNTALNLTFNQTKTVLDLAEESLKPNPLLIAYLKDNHAVNALHFSTPGT